MYKMVASIEFDTIDTVTVDSILAVNMEAPKMAHRAGCTTNLPENIRTMSVRKLAKYGSMELDLINARGYTIGHIEITKE